MEDNTLNIIITLIVTVIVLVFLAKLCLCIRDIMMILKGRKTYRLCKKNYLPLYGVPNFETGKIALFGSDYCFMMAFDMKRVVIINGVEYPYDSILDFSYSGQEHRQYHSSFISTLLRGEIGRATIGGDKGFLLGTMSTPQYVSRSYTYVIRILSSQVPGGVIRYHAYSEEKGEIAVMILEHILSVNELDRQYGCFWKGSAKTLSENNI